MGNRVGVIFHNDYKDFSPLLYSHNGGCLITENFIKLYLEYYKKQYPIHDSGHKYDCEHMMYDFIQVVGADLHNRICIIDGVDELKNTHKYLNFYDNGCFLVNVNFDNYGIIENDIEI